jgi:tetratricopeptide (TPR) repeat protein
MSTPSMTIVVLLGLLLAQPAQRVDRLPDLPLLTVDNFLPAVRGQVKQAYAAVEANPNDAEANGRLGMVLDAYEQYDAAMVCYRRAHVLDPRAFRWHYLLGWVQEAQGLHEQAAATLGGAVWLNRNDLPARLRLVATLLVIGQWIESRTVAELTARDYPQSAEAHYDLGRALAGNGDTAAAIASYLQACDLFPQYGAAHYALAMAYRKLGRDDESRQHFALYEQNKTTVPPLDDPLRREVTALNLGSVAHIRRGADLERVGRLDEAIAEQQEALRVDPGAVQAHINLVALYGRLGRFDEAARHYQAAFAIDSNQADLHYNYGVLLLKQGKASEAEKAFLESVRINPHYADAHNNLGIIYEQQGLLTDAFEHFSAAVAARPDDRAAHFHLGRILANQQKFDDAIQHFLKTLAPEDENTARNLYALGATYARAGDTANALTYMRRARAQAQARNQGQLLTSIDRDLGTLEASRP